MLLVGDIIRQEKTIKGFDFVGKTFEVKEIDGNMISFYRQGMGCGVMSMQEFETYFVKVEEDVWTEWRTDKLILPSRYRVKGKLIEYRLDMDNITVYAKTHEDDNFSLETGLEICRLKVRIEREKQLIKRKEKQMKELEAVLAQY